MVPGLESRGVMRATTGRNRILDRDAPEDLARGSYGVPEAEQARLRGKGPRQS